MAKSKQKYYVVWKGHDTGIFDSWDICKTLIKNYPGAIYKSFKSRVEAEAAFFGNHKDHVGNSKPKRIDTSVYAKEIVANSISVDAACSGNPGIMEYQGVHTDDKTLIFRQGPFKKGTNNVGEFLAIVHALALCKNTNSNTLIYTDSRTAMAWVRKKYAKTNLKQTRGNPTLLKLVERAEKWLKENEFPNEIRKWNTEKWGEIPADFGRK